MSTFLTSLMVLVCTGLHPTHSVWIDLTYDLENDAISWAGLKPFQLTNINNGSYLLVPYVYTNEMQLNEHVGTHMDAPIHFAKGQVTVDRIAIENFIGPAVVINISEKAAKDRNAVLSVSDIESWEATHGRIEDGSILLVFSGWGKYWGDFEAYMGTKEVNGTSNVLDYRWPAIGEECAQWLVDNRVLKGVGLDVRSLDVGNSTRYPAHQILLGSGMYGLESVANLDKLPARGATLYVMPMKIRGGSGGPTRILARIGDDPTSTGSRQMQLNIFAFLLFLFFNIC